MQTFSSSYRWHSFDNEAKSRPTSAAFMYLHRRVLVFCVPLTCCSFFSDVELIIFWFISTHFWPREHFSALYPHTWIVLWSSPCILLTMFVNSRYCFTVSCPFVICKNHWLSAVTSNWRTQLLYSDFFLVSQWKQLLNMPVKEKLSICLISNHFMKIVWGIWRYSIMHC